MRSAPEDYGLTADETIAHTADVTPPSQFDPYWQGFRDEVAALPTRWRGSVDAPINDVIFESIRNVRIAARITQPHTPPRAIAVAAHGYGAVDDTWPDDSTWAESGVTVVRIRVRGFPPSTMDVLDRRDQWILHCIESADDWILRGAVADVMQAFRLARSYFQQTNDAERRTPPAFGFVGDSFAAGLAVIAAAQLTGMGTPPDRMAIGLPTFGDWRWRRVRYCSGSGGEVNMLLDSLREEGERVMTTLDLFDAAIHATAIACPVFCKLARRDDTVPAPTAAAVFNALRSAEKHAMEVPYGHFDGGLANARACLRCEQAARMWMASGVFPDNCQEIPN